MKSPIFDASYAVCVNDDADATEIEFRDATGNAQPVRLSRATRAQLIGELLAIHSGPLHENHPSGTIYALVARPFLVEPDHTGIEIFVKRDLILRVAFPRDSLVALRYLLNRLDEL